MALGLFVLAAIWLRMNSGRYYQCFDQFGARLRNSAHKLMRPTTRVVAVSGADWIRRELTGCSPPTFAGRGAQISEIARISGRLSKRRQLKSSHTSGTEAARPAGRKRAGRSRTRAAFGERGRAICGVTNQIDDFNARHVRPDRDTMQMLRGGQFGRRTKSGHWPPRATTATRRPAIGAR